MDELMKQALEKHKIVRYIPTFLEVMTTYKKLLDAQTEASDKPDVVGRSEQLVCSCGSRLVKTTGGYHCGNAKCSA